MESEGFNFKNEIKSQILSLARRRQEIKTLRLAAKTFAGIDLSDCSGAYFYDNSATFYLREDRKDSKVMHKIAQKLGVDFKKAKSWSGDSLTYTARTKSGYYIEISGAVPATCKIITEEVPLTDEEYERRVADIKRTRVVTRIECEPAGR